jgi:hypothetical protein
MADVIGEALFDIKAGTGGFLSDISGAVGKAEGMFSNMGSSMSSKMQGAGGIMTAGITAPIVAIGAFSVEAAVKVDTAMNSMIRKTGETGTAASGLETSFKNVFAKVPEDADKVADAMSTVHNRLGLTGTDLEGVTKQSIDLARLMGTDLTSTTESVAKAFEAWHTPTSEMSVDLDKLYRVSTQTGVKIEDMTGALSKIGAVASAAHVPMDSVTAAVGSLAAGGVPAKQGVSIITEAITKMQDAGMDAGKELPAMLQRIADGHATAADKTLLGAKNYDKLSGSLTDAKNGYTALTGAMDDSKGGIDKQAEATMTFSDKLKIFKNDLMLAFEPLGKVLINVFSNVLKTVQPILPVITGIFGVFSTMPAPVQLIVVAIAGILAALGPILMILPMLASGFGVITTIMGVLGIASLAAFAPFIIAGVIIAGVAILLYLLYTRFKPFHDAVDQVVGWIKTLLGDLMSGDFGKLGNDFKKGILGALDALKKFDWGGFVATLWGFIAGGGLLGKLIGYLKTLDWGGFVATLWGFISGGGLLGMLIGYLQTLDWGGFVATIWGFISGGGLFGMLISFLQSLDWGSFATTVFNALKDVLGGIVGWISSLDWGQVGNALASAIGNWLHTIKIDTHIPGIGVVTLASGAKIGHRPGGMLAIIGEGNEDEYVIPESKMGNFGAIADMPQMAGGGFISGGVVSSLGSSVKSTQAGNTTFNVAFNNATLTSVDEAERLGRKVAYSASEYLRRSGHSRG